VLSKLYPDWWLSFAALIALDVVSHWFQTYAKMMEGKTTHKGSDNPLLNFYYSFPYLLICCVGNEGFFIALYVLNFSAGPMLGASGLFSVLAWVFFPISAFKNFMNVVQLYDSCHVIASLDLKELKAKEASSK
jgi:CDP-diacylglycerol--inositol 3-phosphatidyltransferase